MDNNNMFHQNENQDESQNAGQEVTSNSGQGQYQQPYQQQIYGQQSYQQQPYQQSPYQNFQQQPPYQSGDSGLEEPVSFGDWMITMLLMCIPCVNIVLMFVWAFSAGTNKSKSNYFKAYLVWMLIYVVLIIVMMVVFGATFAALWDSGYYY